MTKTYLKIEGSDSFVRDTESGAIININTSEFDKLKKIREYKKNKENERIQNWYFKLMKLGSMLFLGPLYKSILQISMIFGSNFKKKKSLTYLMLFFMLSGMFLTMYQFNKTNIPWARGILAKT